MGDSGNWACKLPIVRKVAAQRLAFGWASVVVDAAGLAIVDKQQDIIPASELERAAYAYVETSRDAGEQHERRGVGTLVESVVMTREKRAAMGLDEAGPTGWWVGFRLHDDATWARVESGELAELSIAGRSRRDALPAP